MLLLRLPAGAYLRVNVCSQHLELVASWISSMCVLAQDVDMLIAAGGCPDNRMGGLIESVTPFSFAPPCFLLSKGEEGMSGSSIACRLKSKVSLPSCVWAGSA